MGHTASQVQHHALHQCPKFSIKIFVFPYLNELRRGETARSAFHGITYIILQATTVARDVSDRSQEPGLPGFPGARVQVQGPCSAFPGTLARISHGVARSDTSARKGCQCCRPWLCPLPTVLIPICLSWYWICWTLNLLKMYFEVSWQNCLFLLSFLNLTMSFTSPVFI